MRRIFPEYSRIAAINSALTATMPRRPRQQRRTPDTALSEAIALPAILRTHRAETRLVRNFEHKPFVEQKCSDCHNDPESKEPLKTALPGASLCYNCHKDKESDFKKSVVHSPVGTGQCTSCHNPHASDRKAESAGFGEKPLLLMPRRGRKEALEEGGAHSRQTGRVHRLSRPSRLGE